MDNEYDKLVDKIRTHINRSYKINYLISEIDKWNIICTSLDVLHQIKEAIEYFVNTEYPKESGGQFLYVSGLLQTLFVQQDALLNLSKELFNTEINLKNDFPEMWRIRNLRNTLVGHPTNASSGKKCHCSHFCWQTEKSDVKFITYHKHDVSLPSVDLFEIITTQEKGVLQILTNICSGLDDEFKIYLNKYWNRKMKELFNGYDYDKEKLRTESSQYVDSMIIPDIKRIISNCKNELDERYHSWKECPGCSDIIEDIEFCLQILTTDKNRLPPDLMDTITKNYADYLCYKLDDLYQVAVDIDAEIEEDWDAYLSRGDINGM